MFKQNENKLFFVYETFSQKICSNIARPCKNEFYVNKIKLNWLNLFKKIYYGITYREP